VTDGPIRLLLADDHPVVRDGLAAMLSTQPDFVVVAQAASGAEALAEAERTRPDVVLLDLEMPGTDGLAALEGLRRTRPEVAVLIFTAFDTDERILGALRAGAAGYLLKGAPRDEVFHAIRVVHAGGSLLQPVVATRLLDRLREGPPGPSGGPGGTSGPADRPLTPRELEVLRGVAEGRTNGAIAASLGVTERTVKFHVSAILAKLGAANRAEAVAMAARRGLMPLPDTRRGLPADGA